jgi:hypothetical protein
MTEYVLEQRPERVRRLLLPSVRAEAFDDWEGSDRVGTFDLAYYMQDRDRHGNLRHYFRRDNKKIRLPEPAGSPAFFAAYLKALEASGDREASGVMRPARVVGTFERACAAYYTSDVFLALDKSTRSWRRRELDLIIAEGVGEIEDLTPRIVADLVAERPSPATANQRLKALKALLKFAVVQELVSRNAAAEVRKVVYAP